MQTQQRLWGHADTSTIQPRLFAEPDTRESGLNCTVCDRAMIYTPNGFIACPAGHGKLIERTEAPADADAFDLWALEEGLTS